MEKCSEYVEENIDTSLIKSVLKSIELYLSLKNKALLHRIRHNHEKAHKRIIQELEILETGGSDADRADLLQTNSSVKTQV